MTTNAPDFQRRGNTRYSRLGHKRKSKQRWKKPNGRDNKMREKRRGYPVVVSIGYGKPKTEQPKIVRNLNELKEIKHGGKIILGNIGNKKKLEMIKKAKEMKLEIVNLNEKKFSRKVKIKGEKK